MSAYYNIKKMENTQKLENLRHHKVVDFQLKLEHLRLVMKIIGKYSVNLYTSEPIMGDHSMMTSEKKFAISITQDNVRYLGNEGLQTVVIDDAFLKKVNWFQLYVYVVEMELELIKINNHLEDSYAIHEDYNPM